MSFSIYQQEENGLSLIVLEDKQTGTTASILPAYGAMLHSFDIPLKEGKLNVIANYADPKHINADLATSFKSSKLSPFACRIADGKYTFNGQLFEFPNKFGDGTAIHGLLYNKPFTVASQHADDKGASVTLEYKYDNENEGYPYQYTCAITYSLMPSNTLELKTVVTNNSGTTIPMQDGWHPYFTLGNDVNDCLLQFHGENIIEFNEHLVPTGKQIEYQEFNAPKLLNKKELDNCFSLRFVKNEPAAIFSNPRNGVSVSLWPDESYPFLQIYTPPHRKSIAIENLSATPDAFNNKMGLILLPAGESKTFTVKYQANQK
jgi:aldose 1-epimerase